MACACGASAAVVVGLAEGGVCGFEAAGNALCVGGVGHVAAEHCVGVLVVGQKQLQACVANVCMY